MQQEISVLKAEIDALKIRLDSAEKSNFALHSKLADTEKAKVLLQKEVKKAKSEVNVEKIAAAGIAKKLRYFPFSRIFLILLTLRPNLLFAQRL
jgi:chromosome segregation ATPase